MAPNFSTPLPDTPVQKEYSLTMPLRLAFCARINPKKGLHFLLQALDDYPPNGRPLELDIIGPNDCATEYALQIEQQCQTLPKNVTVRRLGGKPQHEIVPLLHKTHAYILPSQGENFGHSIVEAVAAGCLPLLSDQTPWTKISGFGGWQHTYGDHRQLLEDIITLSELKPRDFTSRQSTVLQYFCAHSLIQDALNQNKSLFTTLLGTSSNANTNNSPLKRTKSPTLPK